MKKHAWSNPAMLAAVLLGGMAAVSAQAQTPAGEKLYKQNCAACHAIAKDAPAGMGPNLFGIVGRDAAATPGYSYSPAFKKALKGEKWTQEMLDKWLEQPQNVAKGTYMMYQQPDAAVRAAIIAYLSENK
jgi:cytochrome c